jgi:hypothetical protein
VLVALGLADTPDEAEDPAPGLDPPVQPAVTSSTAATSRPVTTRTGRWFTGSILSAGVTLATSSPGGLSRVGVVEIED